MISAWPAEYAPGVQPVGRTPLRSVQVSREQVGNARQAALRLGVAVRHHREIVSEPLDFDFRGEALSDLRLELVDVVG